MIFSKKQMADAMRMRKTSGFILFFLVIIISGLLNGCTSLYKIDLAAGRQKNLNEDIAFLQGRETMTFASPLTLDDAVRIALENNLDMRIKRLMEEISDDEAVAEKLKMLPVLEADARQQRRNNYSISEYVDPKTGERVLSSSINQEKTSKTFSLELSWNILDFGLSYIRARQAALSSEVRHMERVRQAQTLALEISSAYWKSLLAEQNLKYIRKIEENILSFKKKTEGLIQQQRLDPIVAKEMEKQWANLSISASNLQGQISGMRIELCRLMGLTPMTRFELAEPDFSSRLGKLPAPESLHADSLELLSLQKRPELFSADLEYSLQQDEARAALISMFPGITFDFAYYYDANQFLFNNDWYIIGAEMATNLLSLPYKYMSWKSRNKSVTMARFQRLMLTAGIITQVHMTLHDYRIRREQFLLQDNYYKISEEVLAMSRERNDAGMKGFSDMAITESMLSTLLTKLGRDQSLVELLSSYNMLMVTLGLDYNCWGDSLEEPDRHEIPEKTGSISPEIPSGNKDGKTG